VYQGLGCDDIMYEGLVDSSKHLKLLYDEVERHYHVITNFTDAMNKKYVCNACHKSRRRDIAHVCDETCGDCMASPPCASSVVPVPCNECNRHFRSRTFFANQKQSTAKRKSVCERKRSCATCGALVSRENHECNKRFCQNCGRNREAGHLCYIRPLKDELHCGGDRVLVLYDFETTQKKYSDNATIHVPNLVCVQQLCSQCEGVKDCSDCVRCGQRMYSFWNDPIGDLLNYLCKLHPWANKIVAIAHNAKAFDLQFILNRAIMLK